MARGTQLGYSLIASFMDEVITIIHMHATMIIFCHNHGLSIFQASVYIEIMRLNKLAT